MKPVNSTLLANHQYLRFVFEPKIPAFRTRTQLLVVLVLDQREVSQDRFEIKQIDPPSYHRNCIRKTVGD